MISNLIMAVKLHKHTKNESDVSYVVVEYATPSEAAGAIEASIKLRGVQLEKDYARSASARLGDKKGASSYKTTVYLGNLPGSISEEEIKQWIEGRMEPKGVFLAKNLTKSSKKYAFLEFADEVQRNRALGVLEQIKQDGVLDQEVIISPAYPNVHSKRSSSGRRSPSLSSDQ